MGIKDKIKKLTASSSISQKWNLIDEQKDTCWSSKQEDSKFVHFWFKDLLKIGKIRILFQNGFHPRNLILDFQKGSRNIVLEKGEYDVTIDLNLTLEEVKFSFLDGYELGGRICIYAIEFVLIN